MLNHLPDEVITSIFSYLLPPVSWTTSRSRHKILFRLGRVSSKCARAAQMLLFEVVHLDSAPTGMAWRSILDSMPRARFYAQWHTRKLFLSPGNLGMSRYLIERILATVPAVKELWLTNLSCDLLSLSILPQLQSCYMSGVDLGLELGGDKYLHYVPELRVLALSLCVVSVGSKVLEFSDLLRVEAFPKLTALAVTWSKDTSEPEMHRLDKQLTHLYLRRVPEGRSVRDQYPNLPCGEFKRATSLQHLSVDLYSNEDVAAFEVIPVELSTVRITTGAMCRASLIERDVLEADFECLDSPAYLFVEPVGNDEADMRKETVGVCAAEGIKVIEMRESGKLEDFEDERQWLRVTSAWKAPVPVQRPGARLVSGTGATSPSVLPRASTSMAAPAS